MADEKQNPMSQEVMTKERVAEIRAKWTVDGTCLPVITKLCNSNEALLTKLEEKPKLVTDALIQRQNDEIEKLRTELEAAKTERSEESQRADNAEGRCIDLRQRAEAAESELDAERLRNKLVLIEVELRDKQITQAKANGVVLRASLERLLKDSEWTTRRDCAEHAQEYGNGSDSEHAARETLAKTEELTAAFLARHKRILSELHNQHLYHKAMLEAVASEKFLAEAAECHREQIAAIELALREEAL